MFDDRPRFEMREFLVSSSLMIAYCVAPGRLSDACASGL